MNNRLLRLSVIAGALLIGGSYGAPAIAQNSEAKEKPPMYTYVGNWVIPRAHWADMEKDWAGTAKILDKAMASGTLVGYGADEDVVHTADGATQDSWWSSMSMAGLMSVLNDLRDNAKIATPALNGATKHWDAIYVSRHYNWKPGSRKGAYTHLAVYKLKADAPDDAVDTLSTTFIVPLLEKLLADGTLIEYEIDEEAIHTDAPGLFFVDFICANADGLDKANAALAQTFKTSPLVGPALGSMLDSSGHRDDLVRTEATYK